MNINPLPEIGFVKLPQIIGDKEKGIAPIIPVSKTTWYDGIKNGIYPEPVRLSERSSAWRVEDIRELIRKLTTRGGEK